MPEQDPKDVFGGLPRTRPHRRSDKRPAAEREDAATAQTADAAPQKTDAAPQETDAAPQTTGPAPQKTAPAAQKRRPAAKDARATAGAKAKPRPGTTKRSPAKRTTAARSAAAESAQANPELKPVAKPKSSRATQQKPRRTPRPETLRQPPQPAGTPAPPPTRRPVPASGTDILGTTVQAIAELTEIGLSAGARAVRNALSRLPHP